MIIFVKKEIDSLLLRKFFETNNDIESINNYFLFSD